MQHSVPSFLPAPLTVLSNRKNIKKLIDQEFNRRNVTFDLSLFKTDIDASEELTNSAT